MNKNNAVPIWDGKMAKSNALDEAHPADGATENPDAEIARLRLRVAELERLVATDTLTPLFNRRYFMQLLDRWCWRANRYGAQSGLLYIDVDNLKQVNDTLGHEAGDALLVSVADALLSIVRKSDIVARIGGDEFVVLLESITPELLPEKADFVRHYIAALHIATGSQTLNTTVSIGAVAIKEGDRPDALLHAADLAMYADKRAGCRGR